MYITSYNREFKLIDMIDEFDYNRILASHRNNSFNMRYIMRSTAYAKTKPIIIILRSNFGNVVMFKSQ